VVAEAVRSINALRSEPLPPKLAEDAYFAGILGTYQDVSGGTMEVQRDGAFLVVTRSGRPPTRLQIAGLRQFGLWTTEVRFYESDGTLLLVLHDNGQQRVARRITPAH
jgi:hypothetical protein